MLAFSFKLHFLMHRLYFRGSLFRSLYCWAPIRMVSSIVSLQSWSWSLVKFNLPFSACKLSKAFFSFVLAMTPLVWRVKRLQNRSHIASVPSQSPHGAVFQETCWLDPKILRRSVQPCLWVTSQTCFWISEIPIAGSGPSLLLQLMAHSGERGAGRKENLVEIQITMWVSISSKFWIMSMPATWWHAFFAVSNRFWLCALSQWDVWLMFCFAFLPCKLVLWQPKHMFESILASSIWSRMSATQLDKTTQ